VFDCLRREVREETGLSFRPETIAYVRQVLEPARDWNHVEFFVAGKAGRGEPRVPGGEKVEAEGMRITDARFVSRGEMQGLAVWPARLRDLFWDDLAVKFAETRYLGIEEMRP
jgi:ADP-ribose pyrophosphatase YjhB (NUDIX family)